MATRFWDIPRNLVVSPPLEGKNEISRIFSRLIPAFESISLRTTFVYSPRQLHPSLRYRDVTSSLFLRFKICIIHPGIPSEPFTKEDARYLSIGLSLKRNLVNGWTWNDKYLIMWKSIFEQRVFLWIIPLFVELRNF